MQDRLPRYRDWFKDAAQRYGVDWRVIAAIGYQESHWDPAAISPTGVRGIMMLTTDTAGVVLDRYAAVPIAVSLLVTAGGVVGWLVARLVPWR